MRSIAPHYLPLTLSAASAFLTEGAVPPQEIERAALAGLLLALDEARVTHRELIEAVSESLANFPVLDDDAVVEGLHSLRARLSNATIDRAFEILGDRGVFFVDPELIANGAWRSPEGGYNESFQSRARNIFDEREFVVASPSAVEEAEGVNDVDFEEESRSTQEVRRLHFCGTREQLVAASAIAGTPDECIAVDAFAGTGKTKLVQVLAEQCAGRFTHLATSDNHRTAFRQRLGSTTVPSVTLWELTVRMAGPLLKRARGSRSGRRIRLDREAIALETQAEILGVSAIGQYSPVEVLTLVLRAIRRWCNGSDLELAYGHFGHSKITPPVEQAAFLALARRTWDGIVTEVIEGADAVVPVRLYHYAKWLELSGAQIPAMGTLLVDEGHDLPPAWLAMLQRYADGFVLLSDPYQRLRGRPRTPRAKQICMTESVRAGMGVMPTIGQTLDLHKERLIEAPLQGSKDRVTRIRVYTHRDQMSDRGLRAFGSPWTLLAEALRLRAAGAAFRFLDPTRQVVSGIVDDAIRLRHRRGFVRTYEAQAFRSWEALDEHLSQSGNQALARAFTRGFDSEHLGALFASETRGDDAIHFGLIDHCKNLEFSQVTLSRCAFAPMRELQGDELVRAVYLAMTRATDELWIPGDALAQLSDTTRDDVS